MDSDFILISLTIDCTKKLVLSQFGMQSHTIVVVFDCSEMNSSGEGIKKPSIGFKFNSLQFLTFKLAQAHHPCRTTNWVLSAAFIWRVKKVVKEKRYWQKTSS